MKKLLSVVFACFMVFAAVDSALAFTSDSLMLVVYNADDNEVVIDLGSLSGLDLTAQNVTLAEAGSFSLSDFGDAVSSYSDLSVAIFGSTGTQGTDAKYIGFTTEDVEIVYNKASYGTFDTGCSIIASTGGDGSSSTRLSSDLASYNINMNSNGNLAGSMAAFVNSAYVEYAETTLAEDGYVTLYLQETTFTGGRTGYFYSDTVATIQIYADGSVVLNASASPVPVPGSLTLLGIGLLGLAGIRRR
nr:PEP-CTERM sorting domain-containing protein [uncultured Desulfobacter sp.]